MTDHQPLLPAPRGPLTEMLWAHLPRSPRRIPEWSRRTAEIATEDDTQLALHILYGLHYDGFAHVDDGWEWEPSLLELRHRLESEFLKSLFELSARRGAAPACSRDPHDVIRRVRRLIDSARGPSLSSFLAEEGSVAQMREFIVHRSIYQRKEADPHTWAIPRLRGRTKSALVALQVDEYGGGTAGATHAELFAETMRAFDLDPSPGAYIDQVPGFTLATDNLVSLLGLHRRWRGALIGHLAAFEMTSVIPMSRYAQAVRKLLGSDDGAGFYDVHVAADVGHEAIATNELIPGLADTDISALGDVPFGVAALLEVESRFTANLMNAWTRGESSLLHPREPFATPIDDQFSLLSA
jgi:Iron-containing redox enzyme